jgi:hypothetical protein
MVIFWNGRLEIAVLETAALERRATIPQDARRCSRNYAGHKLDGEGILSRNVETAADTGRQIGRRRSALPAGAQQRLDRELLCVSIRLQDIGGDLRLRSARLKGHSRHYQTHIHTQTPLEPAEYPVDINECWRWGAISASGPACRRDSRRNRAASCGRASRPRHISPAAGTAGIWNPPAPHATPA